MSEYYIVTSVSRCFPAELEAAVNKMIKEENWDPMSFYVVLAVSSDTHPIHVAWLKKKIVLPHTSADDGTLPELTPLEELSESPAGPASLGMEETTSPTDGYYWTVFAGETKPEIVRVVGGGFCRIGSSHRRKTRPVQTFRGPIPEPLFQVGTKEPPDDPTYSENDGSHDPRV